MEGTFRPLQEVKNQPKFFQYITDMHPARIF